MLQLETIGCIILCFKRWLLKWLPSIVFLSHSAKQKVLNKNIYRFKNNTE